MPHGPSINAMHLSHSQVTYKLRLAFDCSREEKFNIASSWSCSPCLQCRTSQDWHQAIESCSVRLWSWEPLCEINLVCTIFTIYRQHPRFFCIFTRTSAQKLKTSPARLHFWFSKINKSQTPSTFQTGLGPDLKSLEFAIICTTRSKPC